MTSYISTNKPRKLSDHPNSICYSQHRDRLTNWPPTKVQQLFRELGLGSDLELADWEQRYQESLEEMKLAS